MRRIVARPALLVVVLAVVVASCTGDDGAAESTTSAPEDSGATTTTGAPVTTEATTTTSSTSTTTTTTEPTSPTLAVQGDTNETVEAIQFLLNCNGYGELTLDGVFGPATLAAVEAAQAGLGLAVDGRVKEDTMAALSRSCADQRRLDGESEDTITIVGNATADDPEVFPIALLANSTMAATITRGVGAEVTVKGADGEEIDPAAESTWQIEATGDYVIEVAPNAGVVTFTLAVIVTPGEPDTGDWILETDGLSYRGTKLSHGDDAATVIEQIFEFFGHGIRGALDEFDTDWYTVTDPGDMGLRGIFIENFAFLFFGPDPNNPDRPETFVRHRYEGPSVDAEGDPRPRDYATTAEGITVGDTLLDLKAAYGDGVSSGSNSEEHYYRYSDSGGELCFYFDTDEEPDDFSPIVEIASECRSG